MALEHEATAPAQPLARAARWLHGALVEADRRHQVIAGEATTPDGLAVRSGLMTRGERLGLASADEEVWVVLRGHLELMTTRRDVTARTGDVVHVPENTPGHLVAAEDTQYVCVSVLAR